MKQANISIYEKIILNNNPDIFTNEYLPRKIHNAKIDLKKALKKSNEKLKIKSEKEIKRCEAILNLMLTK